MSKVVVVTGSAQGVGAAVAAAFAADGYAVAIADIDGAAAEATAARLAAEHGVSAIGVAADATDEAAVVALADRVERDLGPLGVWVNNAGLVRPAMLVRMSLEDFERVLRVHVVGTFLGMREAARRMVDGGREGVILNVTSSAGLQGTIGQINYSAGKGAITAMTKSGALELARKGVRVNAVAPVAATPMTERIRTDPDLLEKYLARIPQHRFAEPDEVAGAYVFLASPQAAYITGQVLCVDGGLYMAS